MKNVPLKIVIDDFNRIELSTQLQYIFSKTPYGNQNERFVDISRLIQSNAFRKAKNRKEIDILTKLTNQIYIIYNDLKNNNISHNNAIDKVLLETHNTLKCFDNK